MQITIGAYDADSRSVPVTFMEGEIVHSRGVNACHVEDGGYDPVATKKRVDDVARGVAVKMAVGALRLPEPEPELPAAAFTDA